VFVGGGVRLGVWGVVLVVSVCVCVWGVVFSLSVCVCVCVCVCDLLIFLHPQGVYIYIEAPRPQVL